MIKFFLSSSQNQIIKSPFNLNPIFPNFLKLPKFLKIQKKFCNLIHMHISIIHRIHRFSLYKNLYISIYLIFFHCSLSLHLPTFHFSAFARTPRSEIVGALKLDARTIVLYSEAPTAGTFTIRGSRSTRWIGASL